MDMRQVRADLGTVARSAGWNAWDYQPDDPQNLPAAVVGGISEFMRLNRLVSQFKIGVTFYVNLANPQDAAERLDLVLSPGNPDSFLDVLDSVTAEDGAAWRSVRFDSATPYQRYSMPGGLYALGVELMLELTA